MSLVTRPVAELQGPALDWTMAQAEGHQPLIMPMSRVDYAVGVTTIDGDGNVSGFACRYTTDWTQAGPLIEKYEVSIEHIDSDWHGEPLNLWQAGCNGYGDVDQDLLTAVCRAIVASQLGDTVQVPEELIQ